LLQEDYYHTDTLTDSLETHATMVRRTTVYRKGWLYSLSMWMPTQYSLADTV